MKNRVLRWRLPSTSIVYVKYLRIVVSFLMGHPAMDHLLHQVDEEEPGAHSHLCHRVRCVLYESLLHGIPEILLRLRKKVKKHDGEKNSGAETQTYGESHLAERREKHNEEGKFWKECKGEEKRRTRKKFSR